MNKIIKYGLLGVGGIVGVAVAGAAYVASTFNPNDYKGTIIQAVKESKQRNLRLDGDITLSFFPSIGAQLGRVSLSEVKSDNEFAAVDSLRVSLALMPLLSKQVVVDEVSVSGLKATLLKYKDGSSNIDDLLGKGAADKKQPVKASGALPILFDIASVSVEKTNLNYRDEATGAAYTIKDFSLETGRLANGAPCPIKMSVGVQANQPKVNVSTQLTATLTFDLEKQLFQLDGLDVQASGAALDISNLKVQAGGDVSADLAKDEFAVVKFTMKATGVKSQDNFEATLEVPALSLAKDKFSSETITIHAKLDGASGAIVSAVSLPGLQGDAKSFKSGALTIDLDVKQPEQTFQVKISSPLSGNFEAKQYNLSDLSVALHAKGDKLPNKAVNSEMKGSVQVDVAKESVKANLAGGLLQSQVKATAGVNGFSKPAIRFDVEVDQFDADLYLPEKTEEISKTAETAKTQEPEKPLDLSGLRSLNLEGSLRIGSLKAAKVKATQVRLDVKARDGVVNVRPLTAKLYEGSLDGSLMVDAQAMPKISIKQNLNGINIAPLTKDAAGFDTLEGKGNVAVDLNTQGETVSAMKKELGGTMSLNLADGAIKGINIAKKLRDAQGMLGLGGAKSETQAADSSEKTDFSEFKASFIVNKGVAHNEDLLLKSPLLRMTGSGDINIPESSMNYLAKATLAKTLQGQGGMDSVGGITVPVRASGPFSALKYTLDFNAMVGEVVKQKTQAVQEEVKSKLQDQIKDGLKGFFK